MRGSEGEEYWSTCALGVPESRPSKNVAVGCDEQCPRHSRKAEEEMYDNGTWHVRVGIRKVRVAHVWACRFILIEVTVKEDGGVVE